MFQLGVYIFWILSLGYTCKLLCFSVLSYINDNWFTVMLPRLNHSTENFDRGKDSYCERELLVACRSNTEKLNVYRCRTSILNFVCILVVLPMNVAIGAYFV